MTTLVVLQPGYLPWLGFFDQLRRSDVFVYYDDVQFDKHGWRNRNRIKGPKGPHWLTVPILHKGRMGQRIDQVEIDPRFPWAKKHLETIRQFYAKAPFLDRYLPELKSVIDRPWTSLVELDIELASVMADWLGVKREVYRSSRLAVEGDRNERLLNLCRHFGVSRYLSGNAAQNYLDQVLFQEAGIEVEWQNYQHPVYPQLHGAFEPALSTIDLLLNLGDEAGKVLSLGPSWRGGNA
jgi:hypothetical protein